MAAEMLKNFADRTQTMMDNDALTASLYMDPRFSFQGSVTLPAIKQPHIQVYNRNEIFRQMSDYFFYIYQGFLLKTLKQIVRNKSTVEGEQIEDNLFHMNKSDAEKYFESTIQKGNTTDSQETSSDKILIEKIIKIGQQTRKNFKTDPFEYYEQFREQDPLLYELAIVVFAAPATQVSVERAFNALKLLLSPARYNLKKETLENILLINLNRDLLNIIDFEQMEA